MQLLKTSKLPRFVTGITFCLCPLLQAGDYAPDLHTEHPVEDYSENPAFCDALKGLGKIYKNSEHPFLQELTVFGRFQYQRAWVNANDVNGNDFDETHDEFRRARIGVKGKFLDYFDFKANINLVSDDRPTGGDLDWGYQSFDEALIGFNVKKAFGLEQFDKLHASYGRHKFAISHEATTSSKEIITVERSGISNRVFGSERPTGLKLKGAKGPWSGLLGVYSTEVEDEFIAGWDESVAYQVDVGYQASDNLEFLASVVYNDGDVNSDTEAWDYKWATSLSAVYTSGRFGIAADLIYGDNGDINDGQNAAREGDFWGVVILPHYWLVKDRLQAVFRYQYQGSESEDGIRLSSRYLRRTNEDINDGRGDSHHSYYLGLNYHICGDNAKILAGIEYDDLDTPSGGVDGVTYQLAFRTFF